MEQLSEFVVNHWILVTAFCAVLGLLLSTTVSSVGGVTPQQAVQLINREGAVVIDIRAEKDFASGHIIDAVHLPQADLANAAEVLKGQQGKQLLVCCASGSSSGAAVRQIRQAGFADVQSIKGGIAAWRQDNLPLASA